MNEYIYTVFLRLYDKFSEGPLRNRILQCLGTCLHMLRSATSDERLFV